MRRGPVAPGWSDAEPRSNASVPDKVDVVAILLGWPSLIAALLLSASIIRKAEAAGLMICASRSASARIPCLAPC
jgi:hypothetical protein